MGALVFLAVLLLVGAAIAESRRLRDRQPRHIEGWWHHVRPLRHTQTSWWQACTASRQKSRERRGLDG